MNFYELAVRITNGAYIDDVLERKGKWIDSGKIRFSKEVRIDPGKNKRFTFDFDKE